MLCPAAPDGCRAVGISRTFPLPNPAATPRRATRRWVMYEKPRFHGRKCVLAEGDVEIDDPWAAYGQSGQPAGSRPFRIGSFKRVVQVSAGTPHPRSRAAHGRGTAIPAALPPGLPHPRDQPLRGGERRRRQAALHRLGRGHSHPGPGAHCCLHHRPLGLVSGAVGLGGCQVGSRSRA